MPPVEAAVHVDPGLAVSVAVDVGVIAETSRYAAGWVVRRYACGTSVRRESLGSYTRNGDVTAALTGDDDLAVGLDRHRPRHVAPPDAETSIWACPPLKLSLSRSPSVGPARAALMFSRRPSATLVGSRTLSALSRISLLSSGRQPRRLGEPNAAAPATSGAACEVPLTKAYWSAPPGASRCSARAGRAPRCRRGGAVVGEVVERSLRSWPHADQVGDRCSCTGTRGACRVSRRPRLRRRSRRHHEEGVGRLRHGDSTVLL